MTRPKFLAFLKNEESSKTAKEYAAAKGLVDVVVKGNIENACTKILEGARSPEFLLVELDGKDHDAAFASLDKLANCCEPDTKVIVVGDIDELSFYKELINMGVSEYLLNPLKIHQLERATTSKAAEEKKEEVRGKDDCKIIAVTGTRGGAGASSIALSLAKIYSDNGQPTILLDFDYDFGVVPLMLDIEPSRGLVDALEKPERVDSLFLERVMTKINDNLFVIGAEKNLNDPIHINEKAAQVLIEHLRTKFAYVIVDVPKINQYSHYLLQQSEVVIVTELSIPGLRDSMRIYDLVNEGLHNKRVTFIANKTGINKKYEAPLKDLEAGLGRKVDFNIPFESALYGYNDNGKALADAFKDSKFAKTLQLLADKLALQQNTDKPATPASGGKVGLLGKIIAKK